jgi:hypothetical protein
VTTNVGYAPVNGLNMYYEVHGAGEPLVLLPGAYMTVDLLGDLVPKLAELTPFDWPIDEPRGSSRRRGVIRLRRSQAQHADWLADALIRTLLPDGSDQS